MARIRTVKPDFFRSPDTAKADFPVRIFYQALWCWADDFGIGETNINGLLGFAFPDSDEFTAQDVRRFCADCARHYDVTFYEVAGRHFYAIPSWEKHQKLERRTERRKNPPPDHPDAIPDLRFHPCADSAPESLRNVGAETVLEGEGEQGNAGKGSGNFLVRATEVCHQSGDDVAPSQKCSRHINVINPPDCGGCASARREHKAWKQQHDRAQLDELELKRQERQTITAEIKACPLCDENGLTLDPDGLPSDNPERCTHPKVHGQEQAHA